MKYLITLFYLLYTVPAGATLNEVDRSQIYNKNLLANGGFESGRQRWTASGGSFAVTTSSPMIGLVHATWDASASAQTLTSTAVSIPVGYYGRNGVVSCLITTASGSATHSLQAYDGTNILSTATITSATIPSRVSANFIFPASGSISLRLYANADEPSIAVDDCYLGPAEGYNVSSLTQDTFIGSAYIASNALCGSWTRANTALGSVAADTDCVGPTVEYNPGPGAIQTTDTDLPKFTVNNLPPGRYRVMMTGPVLSNGTTNTQCEAINDGTTTSGNICASYVSGQAGQHTVVEAVFEYTSTANRTYELYVSGTAGTMTLSNSSTNSRLNFYIYRFPLSSEIAYTPDVVSWKVDANISGADITLGTAAQTAYVAPNNASLTLVQNAGSAAVGVSCSSTNDNTVGSTTCSAGSEEPGVVFNLPRSGTVRACFSFAHQIVTAAAGVVNTTFQVVQTANGSQTVGVEGKARVQSGFNTALSTITLPVRVCGELPLTSGKNTVRLMYEQAVTATVTSSNIFADAGASNGQRDVHVTVEYIDQQTAAPILVGSQVSNSTGVLKTIHANLNCDAGSAITSQTGTTSNGVASIGNVSGGACAVTLAGAFSSTPYCYVVPNAAFAAVGLILSVASSSSTAVSVDCEDDASAACTAYDFNMMCVGAP